jgi:amino acid adenylation domain-containing protein
LSPQVSAGLKQLSRREGVTLFMTLLAAFQTLLHRYTRQYDIVVGTVITNRNRAEIEPLIGLFVNSLALRLKLNPELRFVELLQRVKEVCLGAYAHQDVPFEKLVEELQPERDLSRSPLFQTMFILHNLGPRSTEMAGLQLSRLTAETRTAKLDLIMSANETHAGLDLNVEFSTDLFEPIRILQLLEHFEMLVEGIVENPEQRLWELPLLRPEEWRHTLVSWNETSNEYAGASCVPELFAEQVDLNAAAIAVVCGAEELTYGELDQRSNQLAAYLRKQGVGPESVVGLCLERSVDLIVGMLGILKAGGAYLPLDPSYPHERLTFQLQDSDSKILLTKKQHAALGDGIGRVVLLDEEKELIAAESDERLITKTSDDALAYVIYTSGSTGQPKGVMVKHGSVLNLFAGINRRLAVGPGDVWTNCHSAAFDFSVWDIWGPLLSGGRLVIVPADTLRSAAEHLRLLTSQRVTILSLTPSALTQLVGHLDELWAGNHGGSLKKLVVGGEACPLELARRLSEAEGSCWNFYGPTEATVWTSIEKLQAGEAVTIGRPISNTELYVLDEWQQPVPIGARGEIYIGGDGLARGYWRRAELTAERFVPHPYSTTGGERLYRTGDEGRYLDDGRIEYLGRRDQQVKVRGYRIELGEIGAVLESHSNVRHAVVTVREESAGDQRLVGYIVGESWSNEREMAAELRRYLNERLPEYMVPQQWVLLEQLPLSVNGKIDQKSLPAPSSVGVLDQEEAREWTPVEELVAGIWSEVLKVAAVGREQNFFELGGHSLLATQAISRLREVFGVEVELQRLFQEPTVRALSCRIEEQLRVGQGVVVPTLQRIGAQEREQFGGLLPLSFAQQRLWFLHQLEPKRTAHNVPAVIRLKGELDVAALERTVTEIVRRHEVLRTRFVTVSGEPRQEVRNAADLKIPVTDLAGLDEAAREASVKEIAITESRQPFDLDLGPLLHVKLLRLSDEDHVVLLTMHHIVSDGWSMGVLVKEVATLYEAFSQGSESPLPELPVQYSDFAMWQRRWLQDEELERQLAFWRNELAGANFDLNLPFHNYQPSKRTFRCAKQRQVFSKTITDSLKALSRKEGVTLFMTLAALFQTLFHRYSNQSEIVVGTPTGGRSHVVTERIIGFFVNILALRFDLSGNPTFRELSARTRKVTLRALAHQHVPFDRLIVDLQPDRAIDNPSLFHFVLTLQNAPRHDLVLPKLQVSYEDAIVPESQFDLEAKLYERAGELHCSLEYNTDVLDDATIAQMLVHLQALVTSCIETPDVPIESLNITSNDEAVLFNAPTIIPELQESFSFVEQS